MYVEVAKRLYLETGFRFPREVIWAMGVVKAACAEANARLGALDGEIARAVATAARELADGKMDGEIAVDVFQTGSGTGLNMNINEVLAKRASEILGMPVHPNDHVNKSQSSNDVVPTAIRLAALRAARELLLPALDSAISTLELKASEFANVVKAGRTHLRDALPVALGQELGAYAAALRREKEFVELALAKAAEVPLGGTAVGTGQGAPEGFAELAVALAAKESGLPLKRGNPFTQMRLLTDLLLLSSALRAVSVDLYRLMQDVRLMFSGPNTGLAEIDLPSQRELPGSSMMPGKHNPVTAEAAVQAAAQVMGLDHANQIAAMLGEFELSMGIPLMGYNVVVQVKLLSEALRKAAAVVADIRPDAERMRAYAQASQANITALAAALGYDAATRLAEMLEKGVPLEEALKSLSGSKG
jgi:fumarate hydratase class II